MCGIAGIINNSRRSAPPSPDRLRSMTESIRHRGPDGAGHFMEHDGEINIAIGHRRLAIMDPGKASDQPLEYLGRYVISYNGEIYNAAEIRSILTAAGMHFHSKGDAEVIAASFHHWGSNCLAEFDGMFAFAIWDREEQLLFCARDRFGEKPFYFHYDEVQGQFLFASEMKALWAAGIPRIAKPQMFLYFLTLGITEHPQLPMLTFYEGISSLPPAHQLTWYPVRNELTMERYWDLDRRAEADISMAEALNGFRERFEASVADRSVADTSIGLTLSGGIDSSVIALTSDLRLFDTVSASFPSFIKDETEKIIRMAAMTGKRAHLIQPDAIMLMERMEALIRHQEEPFGSAGIFAQFAVHEKAASLGLRVLLDGQGADETLGGYERYAQWFLLELTRAQGWKTASAEARRLMSNGILTDWSWRNRIAAVSPELTAGWLERKARRLHQRLNEIHPEFRENHEGPGFIQKPVVERLNDILYHDTMTGPLQTLLRYADRNAMAHGIETRFPYLNHRLVEYVFSMPAGLKFREGFNKWILRNNYRSRIPEDIVWPKSKTGFEPPQEAWMRDPGVAASIISAKEKLVDLRILDARVLGRAATPCSAYARDNRDWRYWVAAKFI
jgi:asparagine synthase (glutamine-hydrolysing)